MGLQKIATRDAPTLRDAARARPAPPDPVGHVPDALIAIPRHGLPDAAALGEE
jgi:hypothetical protein